MNRNSKYISIYLAAIIMIAILAVSTINNINVKSNPSKDRIEIAIHKYKEAHGKDTAIKKSYYNPYEDKYLYILSDLGIRNVAAMMKKIEKGHPDSNTLMYGLCKLLRLDCEGIEAPYTTRMKWVESIKDKKTNVESTVRSLSDMIKGNETPMSKEAAISELSEYGLLAVPYIIDQIEISEYSLAFCLPELLDEYMKIDKEVLKTKDARFWKSWGKENKEEIKLLKELFNH